MRENTAPARHRIVPSTMPAPFYTPLAENRFRATASTIGPWSPKLQHAGPPSALLARAIAREAGPEFMVARWSFGLARPVPVDEISVHIEPLGGRRTRRFRGEVRAGEKVCMTVHALAMAKRDIPLDPGAGAPPAPPEPGPETGRSEVLDFFQVDPAYHRAVEVRFSRGELGVGDVLAWMRPIVPLVEESETSAVEAMLIVTDAASGVGQALDTRRYRFANADLDVVIHREPIGPWTGLAARTEISPGGVGLCRTVLNDQTGPFGVATQVLFVEEASGA